MKNRLCSYDGCDRVLVARGLCHTHYEQARRTGTIRTRARRLHGGSGTSTYRSWYSMILRCRRPSATGYRYYGGRGITVCERWMDFRNFLADMGERPDGLSLDRIDNAGSYSPENCRWATQEQQLQNRPLGLTREVGSVPATEPAWLSPAWFERQRV